MKKMIIFDPAMCCATGVCGPSVNPELLRVSTVLNNLKQKGIIVERYNLSQTPQAFVQNQEVNNLLNQQGVEILPLTLVDNQIIKTGGYLSNLEFAKYLEVPESYLVAEPKKVSVSKGCDCKGGCC